MAFQLPELPYAYDALEPHIDARTMEIHHTKHHAAYTNNLNAALAGTEAEGLKIEEILANISKYSPLCATTAAVFTTTISFGKSCRPTAAENRLLR